jgi:2-oxoglutarate ferredoxin oxidoreductase subunit beta
MSTAPAAPKPLNRLGLEIAAYRGARTTLCAGCGHNSITERLVESFWEMGVEPWRVAKVSGIGCSSKTPAYFLGQSHGFNAVHGRAPVVATGALLANHRLACIVVSGDGDTASIGTGHFIHMLRRNVPLIYVIENNGVYGLTKGQFSATADRGATLKSGAVNPLAPLDCCLLAIQLGATFVARSFSGDKRQLSAVLKAATAHRGLAVIDVISPCVAFNNHVGSTKSFDYMQDHDEPLHGIGFVPAFAEIEVEVEEGETQTVVMHDGSRLLLRKLGRDYDPTDRLRALDVLHRAAGGHEVLTGVLYIASGEPDFTTTLGLVDEPLATLPETTVRPGPDCLRQIMAELR